MSLRVGRVTQFGGSIMVLKALSALHGGRRWKRKLGRARRMVTGMRSTRWRVTDHGRVCHVRRFRVFLWFWWRNDMGTVRVVYTMLDTDYGNLANLADMRGVKIADIISEQLAQVLPPRGVPVGSSAVQRFRMLSARILPLHSAGCTNAVIAERTGYTVEVIRGVLRRN